MPIARGIAGRMGQAVDKAAMLAAYIEENQDRLYRLAYSYVQNPDLAMDIVQDAVAEALAHVHTLRRPEYLRTWVYRILVNESLRCLRDGRRVWLSAELPDMPGKDDDRGETLDVYRAVEALPPKLRTVVVLRFFEDMKLEEIARVTGTNLSTVKSRLYRSLKMLKTTLGDEFMDETSIPVRGDSHEAAQRRQRVL